MMIGAGLGCICFHSFNMTVNLCSVKIKLDAIFLNGLEDIGSDKIGCALRHSARAL